MPTCAGCGSETSPTFAFCPRCGRRLPRACAGCGFRCEPDFAFCPRCGAARAPGDPPSRGEAERPVEPRTARAPARHESAGREADRRQVTVLFADLSGFTALAERLDPEDVRAFQGALFEMLAAAITRCDGFVEKFVGDAVLAVFGAPVAHEADPARACAAALDMLERGEALSREWAERVGQPVALHVGIHTGPVVAGDLGGGAGAAYAVTGDTVNTTARLLAAAPPGSILASEATRALAHHRFAFEPAGELALRGKAQSIVVHRLLSALSEPGSARGLGALGLSSPLWGRTGELDQLLAAFDRMERGRAQVVSLVGEAGTGKSRLIAEFLARLDADCRIAGMAVRRATCSSLGEPTYGIFGALFREAYRVDPADSLEVARQKLAAGLRALGAGDDEARAIAPVLSYVLGREKDSYSDIEPEQLQRQIALAARALVERRLDNEPLLILVEDLHYGDTASVDLLRQMADRLADRPLMVLLTHRPEMRPPLVGRAAQSIIRLTPLSAGETRDLVSGLFGATPGEGLAHLQDFVAARAGGNPLFVEEILRSLVGKGVLVRQGDRWVCTAACEAVDVPPTLHGLLLSRVDRLPDDARRLLQEAAVVGAVFDEPLLRAVATSPAVTAAALDRLVEVDLIHTVGQTRDGGRYRLAHRLVHAIVYQNLSLARLHRHRRPHGVDQRGEYLSLHPQAVGSHRAGPHRPPRRGAPSAGRRARAAPARPGGEEHPPRGDARRSAAHPGPRPARRRREGPAPALRLAAARGDGPRQPGPARRAR